MTQLKRHLKCNDSGWSWLYNSHPLFYLSMYDATKYTIEMTV